MRALLIGVLLISITITATLFVLRKPAPVMTEPPLSPTPSLSPSPPPPSESIDIEDNGRAYRIAWLPVRDPSAITLIPNFIQKRTARSLIDNKECKKVINGGFYTKDNQPTGLLISEGKTLRGSIPNTLLNGFFLVDKDNRAAIDASTPETPLRIGLQTGPILIREGKVMTLAIRDDEFARRVVAGITDKRTVVFLAIYDPENPWSGPKLTELPSLLTDARSNFPFLLHDALNLDGGSASAFIRNDLSLEELTSVGSFFCIQ